MLFTFNTFAKDMNKYTNSSNTYPNGNGLGWLDLEVANLVDQYLLVYCFYYFFTLEVNKL